MGFDIGITRNPNRSSAGMDWLINQNNIFDLTDLIKLPADLTYLINLADFTVSADTTHVHLAGALRKKALCVFLKSANEIYKKTWSKGNYWPTKIEKLYPTVHKTILNNASFKDMETIIYQTIRSAAFGEDAEIVELYNNLFYHLKNFKMTNELERLLKSKNIDLQKLKKGSTVSLESSD